MEKWRYSLILYHSALNSNEPSARLSLTAAATVKDVPVINYIDSNMY